jgi:ubiquinone/menaquinone biosynthesis C-methylase UbiE
MKVMTNSNDFSATIERFSGFADQYDKFRPAPPAMLGEVLAQIAGISRPRLVVDLGSGTGLSTRFWADKAGEVVGIEPSTDMRHQAEAMTSAKNISYREGFSHQTGLPAGCADIVVCAQALHWMEPQSTFIEARRVLRPGGVFASCDYDWPPTTSNWEADLAFDECWNQVDRVEEEFQSQLLPVKHWEKNLHLSRMGASSCFRFTKEILMQHVDTGNAERLVGLLLSQGSVMSLIKLGVSEEKLGITRLREAAKQALGTHQQPWYWSSRIRYGVV